MAENLGVAQRGSAAAYRALVGIEFAHCVKTDRVVFGQFVTLPFLREHMQKLRAFALFHLFEHGHQLPHVVAVHRTGVGEAEVIEQGIGADTRAVEHAFQPLLHFLRDV